MAINIEIESKVLIDEDSYNKLLNIFKDKISSTYNQTNYYLETNDYSLRKHQIALRIREKLNNYEITLKTPLSEGSYETTNQITKEQFLELKNNNTFPECEIKDQIIRLGLDFEISDLHIITSLLTIRSDIKHPTGTFSIDKNKYGSAIDFELEKEDNNKKSAETFLINVCKENNLNYKINELSKQNRALSQFELEKK